MSPADSSPEAGGNSSPTPSGTARSPSTNIADQADRRSTHVRLPDLRRRRDQRDYRAPSTRRAGLLTVGAAAAELLPRGAWPFDRPSAGQRDRAESSKALTAAATDARVSGRGGQREAGR